MKGNFVSILYKLRQKERWLEQVLINSERKVEHWLSRKLSKDFNLEIEDRSWVPKDLVEPYLTYYIMTHPAPSDIKVDKKYRNKRGLKVNLGAGPLFKKYAPDWITVDICEHGKESGTDIKMDFGREPLPFPDKSVDLVYCSHTVEHIDKLRLVYLLNELSRVMSSRGVLRIICPDLELAVKAYYEKDKDFFWKRWHGDSWKKWNHPISFRGGIDTLSVSECLSHEVSCLNNSGSMSHVNAIDFEYLSLLLRDSGFSNVKKSTNKGSVISEMCADHFDNIRLNYKYFSLYVEASKELDLGKPQVLVGSRFNEGSCHTKSI